MDSYILNKHYLLIQNIKNKLLIIFKPNLWINFFRDLSYRKETKVIMFFLKKKK